MDMLWSFQLILYVYDGRQNLADSKYKTKANPLGIFPNIDTPKFLFIAAP